MKTQHAFRWLAIVFCLGATVTTLYAPPPPNQPPVACFTVSPASGTVATAFLVNASCSTDDKTPLAQLKVRWDWENDGVWDTPATTVKTASHAYPSEGLKTIAVQVTDAAPASSTTTRVVRVNPQVAETFVAEPTIPFPEGAQEPDIDVNPLNPQNIVISALGAASIQTNILYPSYWSTDGGASWTRSTGIGPNTSGDPSLEFDTTGTAFVSTIDYLDETWDGTPMGLLVARSDNGGQTYPTSLYAISSATTFRFPDGSLHTPCMTMDFLPVDYAKLASDKGTGSPHRGSLYAIGCSVHFDLDGDGTCESNAYGFVRSANGGVSWGDGQAFPEMLQLTSSLGVGADGALYLSSGAFGPAVCPSGYGVQLRRSTDGGVTFGAPTCILDSTAALQPNRTWTAADPAVAGRVYVAFNAAVAALGSTQHIFVMSSANGGVTWSAPVRVDDVVGNDLVDHFRPSISVGSGGRIDVAWFDYRNSTPTTPIENDQAGDAYYAYSTDGGATWSTNLRLSGATGPFMKSASNDFLTVLSQGNRALVVYSQNRTPATSKEAYLATVTFH